MKDSVLEMFGERVKKARNDAQLTQPEFAEMLGAELGKTITTPTVVRIEKGTRPTSISEAYAIARILNSPVGDLLPEAESDRILESSINLIRSTFIAERDKAYFKYLETVEPAEQACEATEALARLKAVVEEGNRNADADQIGPDIGVIAWTCWKYWGTSATDELSQIAELFDVDVELSMPTPEGESNEKAQSEKAYPLERNYQELVRKLIRAVTDEWCKTSES